MTDKCDCSATRAGNPAIRGVSTSGPEALRPRISAGLPKLAGTIASTVNVRQVYEVSDICHPAGLRQLPPLVSPRDGNRA